MTAVSLLDRELVRVVDDRLDLASRIAGERIECGPGCTECCIGPFPITRLDATRLSGALERLRRDEPTRHHRLIERASFTADLLRDDFPGDPATGLLDDDDDAENAFLERFAAVPCPGLDPEHGTCDVYDERPITCRTFGPPVRLGNDDLPPCRLCFAGASRDEIERCRIDPDPDGLEDRALDALPNGDAHTRVAFALLADDRSAAPSGG